MVFPELLGQYNTEYKGWVGTLVVDSLLPERGIDTRHRGRHARPRGLGARDAWREHRAEGGRGEARP